MDSFTYIYRGSLSVELNGDLNLNPLELRHGAVVAKSSRLTGSNPLGLRFKGVSKSVDNLVDEVIAHVSFSTHRDIGNFLGILDEHTASSIAGTSLLRALVKEVHSP